METLALTAKAGRRSCAMHDFHGDRSHKKLNLLQKFSIHMCERENSSKNYVKLLESVKLMPRDRDLGVSTTNRLPSRCSNVARTHQWLHAWTRPNRPCTLRYIARAGSSYVFSGPGPEILDWRTARELLHFDDLPKRGTVRCPLWKWKLGLAINDFIFLNF